jgi:hypothetical protein
VAYNPLAMKQNLIERIIGRGYWRVNFQPLVAKEKLKLEDCSEIVRKNSVELRGWSFPHFPQRMDETSGLDPCEDYYQGWIDWWAHKEFWRMYKSAQLLDYVALCEDWYEEDGWLGGKLAEKIKPMTTLNIIGAVEYQLAEFFEFLSRLAAEGIYDEGVSVSISLHNIKDRVLRIDHERRVPFHFPRTTGAENFKYSKILDKEEIIGNAKEHALSVSLSLFDIFGWHGPPVETIKADLEGLLSGRA